jgi:hypothetical protein
LFSQPDESKRAKKMFELAIPSLFRLDESKKTDKPILEPILGCFHGLDESQRVLALSRVVPQLDESKRAEKKLELTILILFRLK